MEDQVAAQDRKVKESEGRYSPLTNRPHPSTSLLGERTSKPVESLHEGEWLVDREARTVFVHHCLAAMLRCDVDEVIGQSLFQLRDGRRAETLRYDLKRLQFGIAEQYDYKLARKDTWLGIMGNPRHDFPTGSYNEGTCGRGGLSIGESQRHTVTHRCGEHRRESRSLTVRLPIIGARQMKEGGIHSWEARPS